MLCHVFVGTAYGEQQYPSRLWKIEHPKQETRPSYLLGTMHLSDKDIVNLPPHIDSVVARTDSLAIEVKLDQKAQKSLAELSALRGNKTLSDLIGSDTFQRIVSLLQPRGMSPLGLQRLKPWAVALMLNYPPPSLDPVLDYSLQLRFKRNKKPIYQLETAEEQIQLFDSMSVENQVGFLMHSLVQQRHFDMYLLAMKRLYIEDDLDGLQALANSQMDEVEQPFLQDLFRRLIEERNIKMANRMGIHLQSGNSLIAVGALHLTGNKGLIQLLRYRGYNVTPVLPFTASSVQAQ
ncbi:MAG: TraB/GumN family protein [Pseudomonadales bacterium]|nr:TraB/GumN family protein [Pseudomonadales bacterium]